MRKLFCLLTCFLFVFCSANAQKAYSEDALISASEEELKLKLEEAQKFNKSGKTLLIAGAATAAIGAVLIASGSGKSSTGRNQSFSGGALVSLGALSALVGTPISLIGRQRIDKVNQHLKKDGAGQRLDLKSGYVTNGLLQGRIPIIAVRLTF